MTTLLLSSLLCYLSMLIDASTAAKMAFILTPRHHHNSQPSSFLSVYRRSDVRIYSITRSNNSQLNAANDNDDDDSICNVYQQVKEEDSDWYSKISQMLGDDEMELLDTTFSCGDEKEIEISDKPIETSKLDPGDDCDSVDQSSSSKEDAIDTNLQNRNIEEAPIQESPIDGLTEDVEADAPNSQEESIGISQVAARHSEGHYTQFLDQENEEEDMDIAVAEESSNKEMGPKATRIDSAENVDSQQQQSQIDEEEKRQKNEEPSSSYIVRIYNEFTEEYENVAPLSALEKLGYKAEELQSLRPQVLELIVDDRIPMPRRGIPKRWVKSRSDDQYDEDEARYDDDFGWQVQVVSRKKRSKSEAPKHSSNSEKIRPPAVEKEKVPNRNEKDEPTERSDPSSRANASSQKADGDKAIDSEYTGNDDNIEQPRQQKKQRQQQPQQQQQQREEQYPSEYEQEFRSRRGYRPPPKRSRKPFTAQDDRYNDRANSRRSRRQRGNVRRQRSSKPQELLIERDSYGDDPSGNKFWMDLPVFKDFLRKEAQFRLQILGPDWKESVLDESRWRYDLYKSWLQMIDEGVGENPLYTYTENPRERRRRSRPRSEANYKRDYNTRDSSRSRVPRSQAEAKQRRVIEDDEESNYEGQERRRSIHDDDTAQRRRTRRRDQSRNEQNPRRQRRQPQSPRSERWTNFNDLEESLLKSKGESQGYSQRSVDSYVDEIPRQRRRTSDVNDEDEYDQDEIPRRRYTNDPYDDSVEDEDRQPQARRRRARRDFRYGEFDDEKL